MERQGSNVEEPDETAPLLRQQDNSSISDSAITSAEGQKSSLYPGVLVFIFALAFFADVGGSIVDTPEVRVLEMALCRDYYREHDPSVIGEPPLSYVDEKYCKLDDIQVKLAYLRAAQSLLMTIPGILCTFPYGLLSDKIGRKPVMFLGLLGQILALFWTVLVCYFHWVFPTRLVLLSPIFLVLGGGNRVLSAIMYTIVADVCPEHMRTTIYYGIGVCVLTTEIVMVPIGSWLLSKDLWLPFKFSFPIMLSALLIVLAMPETLMPRNPANETNTPAEDQTSPSSHAQTEHPENTIIEKITSNLKQTLMALNPTLISKRSRVCFVIIFITSFARQSSSIFVQYTSKLLGWSIATTGYILSIKGFITLCVLVALVGLTQLLERKTASKPLFLDAYVVRLSLVALAAGSAFVGLGSAAAVLIVGSILDAAGAGISQALQGMLASLGSSSSAGQVFAGAALIELLARLSGSIAFAGLFDLGLGSTVSWGMGIPYFVAAMLHVSALVISFILPVTTER